jgi:hypothetical protein
MEAKNVTEQELREALNIVNKKYDGNIRFKRIEPRGRRYLFTLTVNDSHKAGGRISAFNNRRVCAACWHVHGDFFDALIKVNEKAEIISSGGPDGKIIINKDGGNWQDRNIGSQMQPLYYSEACDCERS